MNRVTIASAAFLALALALSAWLLLRTDKKAPDAFATVMSTDPRAGLTFAEWSVRSDGVLLADIDPGQGMSSIPRRFMVVPVKVGATGIVASDGPSFSWAPADRSATAGSLFALGFRVNTDGRAFVPPDDPLWSDPVPDVDGSTEQVVTLKAKGSGATAHFKRSKSDPRAIPYWGRRAIGMLSSDGHLVYVTPDAIVIPAD